MAVALAAGGSSTVCMVSGAAGAVAISSEDKHAHTHSKGDLLIAISGHPRLDDALLGRIEKESGIAHAIAEGYVLRGTRVLESLLGTFALAIVDSVRGEALLAADRMGVQPLCYATHAGRLVFGSTLDALNAFPGIDRRVDLQAIYDFVHFHMIPAPATVYAGRRRLLPGTYLHWSNGAVRTAPYWEMRFIEDDVRPFPQLKEEFLALVRTSVARAAEDGEPGTFLSGGTDSSTIAGMLGEVRGEPARTYSIGFKAEGYDESGFARIAAKHFGTRHREYYVSPDDVVEAIPRIAAVHDQPFGNSSAVPTFYCAKLAREDSVSTLLGGDGGDELFGGNSRYATQYVYSLYSDLPPLVRKAAIEPVAALFPAVGVLGKAQRYITTASLPMPARYDNYNLLDRVGADTLFTSDFLAAVDRGAPAQQFEQAYGASNAQSLINRMMALDLKYTLADNDLPKVARSCALAGIDVRFPLLDDELVAFSARLPPKHKLRGTQLRYFFKKALQGFLPDETIRKTKHGFGLPFGTWLQSRGQLWQIARDSLEGLKGRRIFRAPFVDDLLGKHLQQHPPYYGTLVWILMMLEHWLNQHRMDVT
jgi:asparagine synthase (glutamine-hydrolysing)